MIGWASVGPTLAFGRQRWPNVGPTCHVIWVKTYDDDDDADDAAATTTAMVHLEPTERLINSGSIVCFKLVFVPRFC